MIDWLRYFSNGKGYRTRNYQEDIILFSLQTFTRILPLYELESFSRFDAGTAVQGQQNILKEIILLYHPMSESQKTRISLWRTVTRSNVTVTKIISNYVVPV